jgi:uncharacterized membrane protein YsdA (DUF1294 family)
MSRQLKRFRPIEGFRGVEMAEVRHDDKRPRGARGSKQGSASGARLSVNPHRFYGWGALLCSGTLTFLLWFVAEASPLLALLVGVNLTALFFMGLDKNLSKGGSTRTPEAVVYVLALLGGTPGVLLGMHMFRHKTKKVSFQFVLLLIAAAQIGVAALLGVQLRGAP